MRVKECNPASQSLHMTLIAAEQGWPGLLVYIIVIPQPIVSGPFDNRHLNEGLLRLADPHH